LPRHTQALPWTLRILHRRSHRDQVWVAVASTPSRRYKLETISQAGSGDLTESDVTLPNPAATERLAAMIAAKARAGDAILLSGDLGAGKTHFARGFINALTPAPEEVPSPTFTLVQTYDAVAGGQPAEIWHFDLYRLKSPEETYELGIEEAFAEGIVLVEWPDRLGGLAPRERLEIRLGIGADGTTRQAQLRATESWCKRLAAVTREFGATHG
jgi:tRNA threonylcarbamoyladenosine biosynthesis protein TsaE